MGEILFRILFWLILLPVLAVTATPFILIVALFAKDGYRAGVRRGYSRVLGIWKAFADGI